MKYIGFGKRRNLEAKYLAMTDKLFLLTKEVSAIKYALNSINSKCESIEQKMLAHEDWQQATHARFQHMADEAEQTRFMINNVATTLQGVDDKIQKLSSIHANVTDIAGNEYFLNHENESLRYVNYQKESQIPTPIPISLIENKLTGESVPHYNYAANYPPHSHLPNNLDHIIVTLPNSGTHMAVRALALMGKLHPYGTHATYSTQYSQLFTHKFQPVKKIIVVRDLRDLLCSELKLKMTSPSDETYALLRQRINTSNELESFGLLTQLRSLPNVLLIRFEDLFIHERTEENNFTPREKALMSMGNFLNLQLNDSIIRHAADNLLGNTWNYDPNTRIGYWKTHFNAELVDLFKQRLGSILLQFGYEKDDQWTTH